YSNSNPTLAAKLRLLLQQLYRSFGWQTRLYAPTVGRYIHFAMQREEKRLVQGWSPEPATFCEKKAARQTGIAVQATAAREQGVEQLVEPPLLCS
ncbi:MAG: hypothetical protein HY885_17220, partial [Deltaproteobacteria bacterium]|nr:hypothetical protein [Deltaproteobacteria bacterium]